AGAARAVAIDGAALAGDAAGHAGGAAAVDVGLVLVLDPVAATGRHHAQVVGAQVGGAIAGHLAGASRTALAAFQSATIDIGLVLILDPVGARGRATAGHARAAPAIRVVIARPADGA